MTDLIPTKKLFIRNPDSWEEEMLEFGSQLAEAGERPWFEVRWPAPVNLSAEQARAWIERQEDTYDAVEVIDGVIHTLPPYAELLEGKS